MINIGIIGAGRWGPNIIGSLQKIEGSAVTHACDINPLNLDIINKRFPAIKCIADPKVLINQTTLDAVVIATPVETHLHLVELALRNGKHVFVEKPFGLQVKLCQDLCALAKSKNLQIMVGHVFLFNNAIIELKNIINSGEIGEILHLEARRTNLGPVRNDVNAAWDLTSHDLSIFDYLLDSLPQSVSCIGSNKLDTKIADTTYTSFLYPNNIIAHAHASWLNPRKVRQITVVGSKKMTIWDDLNIENPITIYDSSIGLDQSYYSDSFSSHRLSYKKGTVIMPAVVSNEPLLDEMKHFLDVIKNKSKCRSTGTYATENVRSLVAANHSLLNDSILAKIR